MQFPVFLAPLCSSVIRNLDGSHFIFLAPYGGTIALWYDRDVTTSLVTYEVNIHKKRKVTVQNMICTQGLSLIIVVLFSRYTDIETLFSFISIIKKDSSMWSSIFWETHWYCLLGMYVIDPVWPSSLLALEHDSLLDNTKVQRSNRKALFFKYVQLERNSCV